MIELKTIENKQQLIASVDIQLKTKVLECSWSNDINENFFLLPKMFLSVNDSLSFEDLFTKVTLVGIAKFISINEKGNVFPVINYEDRKVFFVSNKNIKKDELISYMFLPESFPHVTIQ